MLKVTSVDDYDKGFFFIIKQINLFSLPLVSTKGHDRMSFFSYATTTNPLPQAQRKLFDFPTLSGSQLKNWVYGVTNVL